MLVTSDQVAQFARRRVIESGKAMLEMSTPVTSIWDGVLLLPLVGIVDSQRTQDIMEKSLSRIPSNSTIARNRFVILKAANI